MDYLYETMADKATNRAHIISGQGKMETTASGAKRESNEGRGRFDLLPYEAIEALAKWYELGATKYPERNWEAGLSVKDCINRMIRHSLKAGNGWTDEDHLAAVMWNAAAAITMMQRHPECNDHPWRDTKPEFLEKKFHINEYKEVEPGYYTKTEIGKLSKTCDGCKYYTGNCTSGVECHRDENGFLTGYIQK